MPLSLPQWALARWMRASSLGNSYRQDTDRSQSKRKEKIQKPIKVNHVVPGSVYETWSGAKAKPQALTKAQAQAHVQA